MHPIEIRSLNKHKTTAGRLLLEMTMVVFSILLALNLESCKERSHERELARIALHNIRLEIENNKKGINTFMPRQEEMIKYLAKEYQTLMEEKTKGSFDPNKDRPLYILLYPVGLQQTAWDTATITKALGREDYNLIQSLADLYIAQKWMDRIEDKWMQAFINPVSFRSENQSWFLPILISLLQNYTQIERSLLISYDKVLPQLAGY